MAITSVTAFNLNPKITNKFMTRPSFSEVSEKPAVLQNQTLSTKDSNASKAFMAYFQADLGLKKSEPNFTGYPCSTKDFKIKRLPDIPCACCGKEMMIQPQIREFVDVVSKSTGDDLANYLNANLKYLRPVERSVARYVANVAVQHSDLDIQGILVNGAPKAEKLLLTEQKKVVSDIAKKADELYGKNNKVSKYVQTTLNKLNDKKRSQSFERKPFLAGLDKISKFYLDEEKSGQLMDIAIDLPSSSKNINAFLVKYSRRAPQEIAKRLTSTAIMTAEHVHPKSLGGPNHTANYMGECQSCNGGRGTKDLQEWFQEYPNMPRSSQRYIDEVTERIENGDLDDNYDDYPLDIKKTLANETRDVIVLKVKNPEEIEKMRKAKTAVYQAA